MNDKIIINVPTGTRGNYNKPGLYVTNIIMQELSNIYDINQYYTLNILDSYGDKEQYLDYYIKNIEKIGLSPYKILIDKDLEYKEYLDYLVRNGAISTKKCIHEICNCKRVDIIENFNNPRTKLFDIRDDKKICKKCGSECNKRIIDTLIINFDIPRKDFNIFPQKYENELTKQIDFFSKINYPISKERETGLKYTYKNKEYNIDIDFINNLLLSSINANDKTVISSTHLIKYQALAYLINNYFNQDKYNIILHPYLINPDNTRDRCYSDTPINTDIEIDKLLYPLTIVSNGLKKEEYKWNIDFYKKVRKFLEQRKDKYELIEKILTDNITPKVYNFNEIEKDMLCYRDLLYYIYTHKLGGNEDEIRATINNQIYKRIYHK